MDHKRVFKKTAVNTSLVFVCLFTSSTASLLPDGALAFTVSSICMHVAGFAAMFAPGWVFWLAYLDGDLEGDYDPVSLHDLARMSRQRVAAIVPALQH